MYIFACVSVSMCVMVCVSIGIRVFMFCARKCNLVYMQIVSVEILCLIDVQITVMIYFIKFFYDLGTSICAAF